MRLVKITVLMLVMPIFCIAQEHISLEKCIELAKSNNQKVVASGYQIAAAKYEKKATFSNYLPTIALGANGLYSDLETTFNIDGGLLPVLSANGLYTGQSAYFPGITLDLCVDWLYNANVQLQQPLFMGGKIIAGHKMGKLGQQMALQKGRLTVSQVIYETAQAYANVVQASEMVKVATAYNELLVELKRSVDRAFERGVKTKNDVLKVQVKLSEGQLNLMRAQNAVQLATMNLCHYIGYTLTTQLVVDTIFPEVPGNVAAPDITLRPEVQLLAYGNELMRQKVNVARADMLPQLGVVGQYGYINAFKLNGNNLFDDWNFAVAFQLSVPIFNNATYNKYRSAKMQYKQCQANQQEELELMTLQITQTINSMGEAAFEVKLAESACHAAAQNLHASNSQYNAGVESLSELLEAQVLWLQAKQTLIQAKVAQYLRFLDYKKASGILE